LDEKIGLKQFGLFVEVAEEVDILAFFCSWAAIV